MISKLFAVALIAVIVGNIEGKTYNCADGFPSNVSNTTPSSCCAKAHSFDLDVFKSCFNKYGNNPQRAGKGLAGPMNAAECVFECVLNSTKAIQNGLPNAPNLIKSCTASLAGNQDWIPVVTAGINYCIKQTTDNANKLQQSLKNDKIDGTKICSPSSAFMIGCMFTYEFRNCPAKYWNQQKNPACNELKDYFTSCPTPTIN
uniref:Odorant-binding protein 18 n=1 Tax=Propsilocerus akamusi TaxID=903466 RepID=A0A7D0TEB6_9DIPT|nr:odorant-binding protein 18 [Propsilocerus akamusi]